MDEATLDAAREARGRAERGAERLREELDVADKWRKLLTSVIEGAPERPTQTSAALDRQQDLIRSQESFDPEGVAALRSLWRDCQQRSRAAAIRTVRDFAPAAEAAGLTIDASSRHPRYTFADHFIEVELSERDLAAKITVRHGDRPLKVPLDIPVVVERLKQTHERLFERPWDADAFLKALRDAYRAAENSENGVPVRDLAKAMAPKGRKAALDEFAVDLGRLLREGGIAESLRITTNQTRDTARGLLLLGLEQGGYVLSIKMEEAR